MVYIIYQLVVLIKKMDKKKIIFFIGEIGYGGSERQMSLMLNYLDKKQYEYHVIIFNPSPYGDLKEELKRSRVQLYFIPQNISSIPARIYYLYKLIKPLNPIVIFSWTIHNNAYAGVLGKILSIPITIGSVRGSLIGTGFLNLPRILKWVSLRLVSLLVVNSNELINELTRMRISKHKIKFIPNCVLTGKIKKVIPKKDDIIICTIGNLRSNKNHKLFIDIIEKVLEKVPKAKGWIIGQPVADEPDLKNELENYIKSKGLIDGVKLLGFQGNISKYLQESSIYLMTSLSEGTPNAILEAMSFGIPVVSTEVGGVPDIINSDENGFLIKSTNMDGFVNIIINLLNDEALRIRIGDSGKKYVEDSHYPYLGKERIEEMFKV